MLPSDKCTQETIDVCLALNLFIDSEYFGRMDEDEAKLPLMWVCLDLNRVVIKHLLEKENNVLTP